MNPGDIVGDRYRLEQAIGKGQYGSVWQAVELFEGEAIASVAIKVLRHASMAANRTEVRTLAGLNHGGILSYKGAFKTPEGDLAIVTEFADQGDVASLLRSYPRGLPEDSVREIILSAAEGLAYLNKQRLVHRHLKPSNILFVGGQIKLADMGLVKEIADEYAVHSQRMFSPYHAPETYQGKVGFATDIYALGVIAYELFTGRVPFGGTPQKVREAQLNQAPELPEDLPDSWRTFFGKTLAKEPRERWSAAEVIAWLSRAPEMKGPPPETEPARSKPRGVLLSGEKARPQRSLVRKTKGAKDSLLSFISSSPAPRQSSSSLPIGELAPSPKPPAKKEPTFKSGDAPFDLKTTRSLEGHRLPVLALCLHPRGKTLYSGGQDHSVMVWDLVRRVHETAILGHEGWVSCLDVTRDGKILASGSYDFTVRLHTMGKTANFRCMLKHPCRLDSVKFWPHGKLLVTSGEDGLIRVWDFDRMRIQNTLAGHRGRVRALCFSNDGKMLFSGGDDGSIHVWEVDRNVEINTLEGHTSKVSCLAMSPSGDRLVSGGFDGAVRIWSTRDLKEVATIETGSSRVLAAAFHPTGRVLATLDEERQLSLWNLAKPKVQMPFRRHQRVSHSVLFHPEGDVLFEGSQNQGILVWDLA